MSLELVLIGTSVHILIWDKLPEWGTWFKGLLAMLPRPLQTLYQQWHCAFCAGFWIALALHGLTGVWTVPNLANLPGLPGWLATPTGWFLDALATATLIYAAVILLRAIGLPAMKAHMMKDEFIKSAFGADQQDHKA